MVDYNQDLMIAWKTEL